MKKLCTGFAVFALFLTGCGSDTLTVVGSSLSSATARAVPFFAAGDFVGRVPTGRPTGSPTSLKFTVFRFFVSANTDCSSPILAGDNGAAGAEIDFYASPTLFTGSPDAGSYPCIAIEANDILTGQVDAAAATAFDGCEEGASYMGDLYREGEGDDGLWKDTAGTAIDATGSDTTPGTDKVVFFATTDAAAAKAGPLAIHDNQIVPLNAALTVPGTSTFYADFKDGIDGDATTCKVEQGSFGFR